MSGDTIRFLTSKELSTPLITDTATSILSIGFAAASVSTFGRQTILIAGQEIDRGIAYGMMFLLCAIPPWIIPVLIGNSQKRVVRWFRIFYIQLYYYLFFAEAIHISYLLYNGRSFDRVFERLDDLLFGFQPSLELYRVIPDSPIIVEAFFVAYGFFYLLFSAGIWILFFRKREVDSYRCLTYITLAFYLMYVFYIFFPVAGPKYYFPQLRAQWYEPFSGYIVTGLMKQTFDSMDLYGAAFPSSHAAISVLSLLLNFRYQRPVAVVALPVTMLLLVATVYIYAHFAVDTIAGIALGIIFFLVLPHCFEALRSVNRRIASGVCRFFSNRAG